MLYFFRLIRYKNLLIIILTQYLMRWSIIKPILTAYNFELQFSELNFFFLVMATVLLTAAGYVINDYFDAKTDMVNRPDTVIVGRVLNRRWAILWHVILNIVGIGLGAYISFYIGIPSLTLVFIMVTGILWFYSTTYKRQFLIGNVIVALLTAMVPLMVLLFEIPLLNQKYGLLMEELRSDFTHIIVWVMAFSVFAFLLTMIREIIKDIEDYEGDSIYGRKTLPIVTGVLNSKIVIITFILTTIFSLLYINFTFLNDKITLVYFSIFLLIPLVLLLYKIIKASTKKDYHKASNLTKWIMLSGISYALVANYIINHTF